MTSRKFLLTVLVLILSYVLVILGKVDAKEWMTIAIIAAGIYSSANIADGFVNKLGESGEKKTG